MCVEAVWWRRHRRIIAAYWLAAGERDLHMPQGRLRRISLRPLHTLLGNFDLSRPVTRQGPAACLVWRGAPDHLHTWNCCLCGTLGSMFFFFSNRVGLAGSIVASVLVTLVLLYGCGR